MPPESIALALIPLLPLLGALANGILALGYAHREQGPAEWPVALIGCVFPALACVLTALLASQLAVPDSSPPALTSHYYTWIGSGGLQIGADLTLDRLSAVMALIITFVGTLIHLYSVGYMHRDRGFARYFACLNLFLASMLVLVLARNLAVMFVGWEGVGLCSYLLIGFWFRNREFAAAGSKAFIVNRIGDVGFIVGLCWLYWALNNPGAAPLDLPWLRTHVQGLSTTAAEGIALLLFLGAVGKSAQIPLSVWLPDAMAGPTPVSALIHAATMVTAGVYLVARLHFLYDLAPHAAQIIAVVGTLTALWAALIAIAQNDIKKVLAYSTISQLGYMFLAVGTGAYDAGIFHLFTHAFFKALLFLGAGVLIHGLSGEQDLLRMGGLRRYFPLTHACFLAGTLAIAGIPPFAGFFSKDAILWHAWASDHPVLWAIGLLTAGLTSFYMFRLYFLAFQGAYRRPIEPEAHATPWTMGLPLVVLAAGALLAGWADTPRFLAELLHVPSEWLSHWAAPAIGATEGEQARAAQEWLMTGLALLAALAGLALAAWRYRNYQPRKERRPAWAYSLLQHKFYVDELYDLVLVRPLLWFSRTVLWKDFDTGIIDGTVNGLPPVYRGISGAFRLLQSGHARLYALYVLLGLVGSLIYYTARAMGGS